MYGWVRFTEPAPCGGSGRAAPSSRSAQWPHRCTGAALAVPSPGLRGVAVGWRGRGAAGLWMVPSCPPCLAAPSSSPAAPQPRRCQLCQPRVRHFWACCPCAGWEAPCVGQPSKWIPLRRHVYCKDSCYRRIVPAVADVVCPNLKQLWPSALWLKETVLRVQTAEHPPWKCPSLLSLLQQTCLHCSLTFFFLYFYFCMSFAFQIL